MKSDGIRQVGCGPGAARQPLAPAALPSPPAEPGEARPRVVGADTFEPTHLTADGRLKLIVSFDQPEAASRVRSSCKDGQCFRIGEELPLVNGFTAEVEPKSMDRLLKSLPKGSRVAVDRELEYPDPRHLASAGPSQGKSVKALDIADSVIGIEKVWDRGFTGKGQTIAVIDSGIYPHPDLQGKIVGWVDLKDGKTEPFDTFGHGTHVAGVAAGSGVRSAGAVKGVAPDADLVGVRITSVAEAIKGIQWVIENKEKYNIGVINMSLGDFAARSYKDDPWAQAAEKAVEAGLVVVVAAGNDGPSEGSVSTPGIHPDMITVGALDDHQTLDRGDDTVADFSSRGPTSVDSLTKPDLLAPGVGVFGPLAPGATLDVPELPHIGKDYFAISGTSMATPMVAGLAADLKQANPRLTHRDIKQILVQSADLYLKEGANAQGAGLVDAEEALELALNWPEDPAASQARPATPQVRRNAVDSQQGYLFA